LGNVFTKPDRIKTLSGSKIVKLIKDSKIKVQPSIQGDTVRVSGKDKDDLQAVIRLCRSKAESLKIDLQYTNFRD